MNGGQTGTPLPTGGSNENWCGRHAYRGKLFAA